MSVYRPKGSSEYVYDFWRNKERFTGSCETDNHAAAKRLERKKIAEVEAGQRPDAVSEMTIDVAADKWFEEYGKRLDAAKDYERSLDLVVDCVGARTRLREINGAKVAAAMAARRLIPAEFRSKKGVRTRPVKNSTVNRQILDMLRRIMRRARTSWGATNLPEINWRELRYSEGATREREISDEEHEKLDKAILLQHWRDFRDFLSTYGLRLDEMFFHPDDIYEVDKQVSIRIRDRKDGSSYVIDLLPDDGKLMLARKSVASAAEFETAWYYYDRRGTLLPCKYNAAKSYLRKAITRSGVRNLTIHDHRHDVATKLTRAAGIAVARSQLGHASIATTQRYARISTADRLNALSAAKSRAKSRSEDDKSGNSDTNQHDVV